MLREHPVRTLLAMALASAVIGACAGDQAEQKETFYTSEEYEQNRPEPEPPPDPCMAEDGEPRQCSSNEDCCEGFQCGFDPQRSRVVRYCMGG